MESRPDSDLIIWKRPEHAARNDGGDVPRLPRKSIPMRQLSVDARDKNNRAVRFKVVTTSLDTPINGG